MDRKVNKFIAICFKDRFDPAPRRYHLYSIGPRILKRFESFLRAKGYSYYNLYDSANRAFVGRHYIQANP